MAQTDSEHVGTGGLAPQVIESWERRIGVESGNSRAQERVRLSGPDGMQQYWQHVRVSVDDPDGFDSIVYVRQLSLIDTFCAIRTPLRVERDDPLITKEPSDDLIVTVSTLPGRAVVKQGTRDYVYRPGQLVIVSNTAPYVETTHSVSDPSGLVIPRKLLGGESGAGEGVRRPVAGLTSLARATAAFIRQFTSDTAVGHASEPKQETELAAIELVRAALGQLNDDNRPLVNNELFIRQAAADLIERHHRDPQFSPESICRALHISRRQLYRHFESTGESLAALIAESRLRTAHALLLTRADMPVVSVAMASGFPSVATMRNRFHARYNKSPNELRMSSPFRDRSVEEACD
ncbi:AraC family transcriptional regulator [Williamsia sp. 1138]|uniref:AraC family transcriptional regulator n=1 Tax=Williamsia sp. 1138 TaxID=1903117 RepID=UPI000A1207A5|nr:AraC family transcriptional regulator [Williamsia sp. 1138]OZG26162.1 AraC family transcriptional regulator [Williamsia sp. 1138]